MMVQALVVMGGLGIVIGILLAAASKIFYVYVDPKITEVESVLPGANCGGCGLPGCSANAEAIVAGKASPSSCVAGGPDLAEAIAAIMGVSVEAKEPDIARPGCFFGPDHAELKYSYNGFKDCRAAVLLGGGMKECEIGCLGFGTCARSCPFDAIRMGEDGLPKVDEYKCTGCGTCERVCPKNIITMSSVTRRILKEYTTEDCTTPCQRRCPAGIDIRSYIDLISRGDFHGAVRVIKERNPFPSVIGRICPRPCEEDCRRGLVDEPVAINHLKRFAADYERISNERVQPYKAPPTGKRIAIIGGGVEGLSAAFFSARLGHAVEVYEAGSRAGGLLRSAIAAYRLPSEILDWDIAGIEEMGVKIKTESLVGRDLGVFDLLKEGYDAVYSACGGWDSRLEKMSSGISLAQTVPGIHLIIDLLRNPSSFTMNSRIVIAGGCKIVKKAAQICCEAGASEIFALVRDAMEDEDKKALAGRGVTLLEDCGILSICGKKDSVAGIEYRDFTTGEIKKIETGHIFIAAGRFPRLIFHMLDGEAEGEKLGDWRAFEPYKRPDQADEEGLLSRGDTLSDFSGAIRAIAGGRRAAASIHQFMYGIVPGLPENVVTPDSLIQNVYEVDSVKEAPRQIMPVCMEAAEGRGREIELGFDENAALKEASRCLKCGLICYVKSSSEEILPEEKKVA